MLQLLFWKIPKDQTFVALPSSSSTHAISTNEYPNSKISIWFKETSYVLEDMLQDNRQSYWTGGLMHHRVPWVGLGGSGDKMRRTKRRTSKSAAEMRVGWDRPTLVTCKDTFLSALSSLEDWLKGCSSKDNGAGAGAPSRSKPERLWKVQSLRSRYWCNKH